jgi:phage terminase small subunit
MNTEINIKESGIKELESIDNEEKLPHLRPRLVKFCEAILKDKTQAQARKIAGFKDKNDNTAYVQAQRLLRKDMIKRYLDLRRFELSEKMREETNVSVERIVLELMRLGFSDPRTALDENDNLKSIQSLSDDTAAAISSIEIEELYEGKGKDRVNIGQLKKIKFWNKNDAIQTLAKYKGMLIDRVKIDQPILIPDIQNLPKDKRKALIEQLEDQLPVSGRGN